MPDAVPLIRAVYAQPGHGVGGCLHVQLDDDNLEDKFFDAESRDYLYAPSWAAQQGLLDSELPRPHEACLACFDMLAKMTWSQRRRAVDKADVYAPNSK